MFPSPILGKGSVVYPVQYWEKVLGSPNQYWDRFYRFPSQILEKGCIGSPVQYLLKVVYVLKSNTGKRF